MPYGPSSMMNSRRNGIVQALMNLRNPPPGGGGVPSPTSFGAPPPTSFSAPPMPYGNSPPMSPGALPNFEADRAAAQASKMAGGMGPPGSIGAPMPATTPGVTNYYGNMGGGGMPGGGGGSAPSAPYSGMSMQQMMQPFQPAQGPQMQPGQAWGSPPPIPQG